MVRTKREKTIRKDGDFTTYSQADLRKECKAKGYGVRGDKKELIDRLNGKVKTPIAKKPRAEKTAAKGEEKKGESSKAAPKSPSKKTSTKEATGLHALSQAELRELCKKHKLSVRGNKDVLIKQLQASNAKAE